MPKEKKPQVFKSDVLIRKIDKFGQAAADMSWIGSMHPDDHEEVRKKYRKARLALIEYVIEHVIKDM